MLWSYRYAKGVRIYGSLQTHRYSQGIFGSRGIEAACREHVTFIALCGDSPPHFTTIACFVSTLGEDIAHVFGAVDAKHQVIVCAQAHGGGSEQDVLMPVVKAMQEVISENTLLTAGAGYHSEDKLKQLADRKIDALIADNGMRAGDARLRRVRLDALVRARHHLEIRFTSKSTALFVDSEAGPAAPTMTTGAAPICVQASHTVFSCNSPNQSPLWSPQRAG